MTTLITSTLQDAPAISLDNTSRQLRVEAAFRNQQAKWYTPIQKLAKRTIDIIGASLILLTISPALLLLALAIKVTAPGPIFYKSLRIGKDNKPFHMYKFRTMRVDADTMRDKLREENNLQGELFKIENDPRITPIGKFLRAYSLDEFPQMLNVIQGNMSLVGPRPLPPDESEMFEAPYTMRFKVFPGVTGPWQVGGRSGTGMKHLCELELAYILNWNLLKDVSILGQTIPAVLFSKGAC